MEYRLSPVKIIKVVFVSMFFAMGMVLLIGIIKEDNKQFKEATEKRNALIEECVQYCGEVSGNIPIKCFFNRGTFIASYYNKCLVK